VRELITARQPLPIHGIRTSTFLEAMNGLASSLGSYYISNCKGVKVWDSRRCKGTDPIAAMKPRYIGKSKSKPKPEPNN
jgi:hypothetical protein